MLMGSVLQPMLAAKAWRSGCYTGTWALFRFEWELA